MNALEIQHLTKQYPGFLLDDVSFSLPSGSILGLIGENGAGKSTVIQLIMNALSRDGGTVSVLGTDNQSPSFRAVKEDVGVVLDEACFPEALTAKNVSAIMRYTYKNWDAACYKSYLMRFSLPENKPFRDFSRGMKMKLAIAVAMSHAPKLLVLDEATGGLDPLIRDEILDIFNDFTRDERHSVLLSSHIVSDLEKICDYIAFLHKGRLLFCKEKDRLLEEYAIVKLSRADLMQLPADVILGKKENAYGAEALVLREKLPHGIPSERTSLEDVILYLAKEGQNA